MDQLYKLKLVSYNCKQFYDKGEKFNFINSFSQDCDFILLQEICLYESQFGKLAKIGNGFGVEATSAMDENVERLGRPHGGCAIVWNPKIKGKVQKLDMDHNRVCAVSVVLNDASFIIFNAYMPCDRNVQDPEYEEVWHLVNQVIHVVNPTYIIFGGDMNTDTSRNSPHTQQMIQNVHDCSLGITIDVPQADVP